jgi:hypothetical protein
MVSSIDTVGLVEPNVALCYREGMANNVLKLYRDSIPTRYAARETSTHTEHELLQIAREEGFDFEYVVRASHDDWDRYETYNCEITST